MPQLEAGGETIHYLKAGSGLRTIVLIHGFGSEARSWTRNQPALATAATVYALALPGHGASPARNFGDLDWLAGVVADAIAALTPEPVHLVGHSMGGAIALRTAELFPAHLRALTLIDPAGLSEGRIVSFIPSMLEMTDAASAASALRLLVANSDLISRQIVEDVLAARNRPHTYEAWQKMRAVAGEAWTRREQARAALGRLPLPVEVIWGEQDAVLPPKGLEALPPNVRLHMMPGLGHMPHMEGAKAVNELILDFDAAAPSADPA